MIRQEHWGAIRSLREKRVPKREIARILGITIKTVRKYLRQGYWQAYRRRVGPPSVLDPHKGYLLRRMREVDYSARILFDEIKERAYTGSYEMVKRFVRPHREERDRLEEATMRFETPPGRQSQADWSTVQVAIAGKPTRAQVFVMTLGYSRSIYAVCKPDQRLPALIDCHLGAWSHHGGRTEEILYDNPKTVVLSRDYNGENITWNPQFLDFARYYGFSARLCKPYRARTKGKVESGVKYVKGNFFKRQRHFTSWDDLNAKLLTWCVETADTRMHGTTHRRPVDAAGEEMLVSIDAKPAYSIEESAHRRVPSDCLVNFRANRYSVPCALAGKTVDIVPREDGLDIYRNGLLVSSHAIMDGRFKVSMKKEHYDGLFKRLRRSNEPREPSEEALFLIAKEQVTKDAVQVRDLTYYELVTGGIQ